MAMTVTLTQPFPAMYGVPTTFVATVANSSGGNVNLNSLAPYVQTSSGQLYAGVQIGTPQPSGQTSVAQSGGYQFNVVIPASGSTVFTFQIQIIGNPFASGTSTQASSSFLVGVNCYSSDGSSFSAVAPLTMLAQPIFGPPLGVGQPSNAYPGSNPGIGNTASAPQAPGVTDFQNPFAAVLAL